MTLDKMIDSIMSAEIISYIVQAALEAQELKYEDDHPLILVDNVGIGELVFHRGLFMPEEPILALPI